MEDIEIARNAKLKNITEIADKLGVDNEYLEQYGKNKAKINLDILNNLKDKKNGKLKKLFLKYYRWWHFIKKLMLSL